MAEFSATDAAIEGFRLAGRKPGAVAIWSIAQLLFALVGGALMVLLVGADANAVMGPDSAASWDDPSKAMTMAAGALRVGAVSCITNPGAGLSATPLNHEEVQEAALFVADAMGRLMSRWVENVAPFPETAAPGAGG